MRAELVTIQSNVEEINQVCQAVTTAATEAGFDERTAYSVQLAVCEAVENIVVHGYGRARKGPIAVSLQSSDGELSIDIRDEAPPFNPTAAKPKPPTPPEDPPAGGLGLYILQRVMDEISYARIDDENRLHLLKRARTAAA